MNIPSLIVPLKARYLDCSVLSFVHPPHIAKLLHYNAAYPATLGIFPRTALYSNILGTAYVHTFHTYGACTEGVLRTPPYGSIGNSDEPIILNAKNGLDPSGCPAGKNNHNVIISNLAGLFPLCRCFERVIWNMEHGILAGVRS